MVRHRRSAVVVGLGALARGTELLAQDFSFKGSSGDWFWTVLFLAGMALGLALVIRLRRAVMSGRRQAGRTPGRRPQASFARQASGLGFEVVEAKVLRAAAQRLAPDDPTSLLRSDAGRERLASDLADRLQKREREVVVLKELVGKLGSMRDRQLQERASVRVETDLAVWVVRKGTGRGSAAANEEDDLFGDGDQVAGRLLDLSEGGAALATELPVAPNDRVELWSAESTVWIPPVMAGVLQAQRRPGTEGQVLHLHFIDPPVAELRAAVQALQREAGRRP